MTLFRNDTHRDIWIEHHCRTCFQPDEANRRLHGADTQCPILQRALNTDRKPVEWERNPRPQLMQDTIICNSYQDKPRKAKADKQFEDVGMFDVEPQDKLMIPVEGWPDRPPAKGVDHA